jgi:hypothetical protein
MIKKSILQKSIGLALLVGLVAPLGACNQGTQTPEAPATETTAPAPEGTEAPAPETTETPAPTETKAP